MCNIYLQNDSLKNLINLPLGTFNHQSPPAAVRSTDQEKQSEVENMFYEHIVPIDFV